MAARPIQITLDREHLCRLINSHTVTFHCQAGPIQVRLDLAQGGRVGTDPPQAAEFLKKAIR